MSKPWRYPIVLLVVIASLPQVNGGNTQYVVHFTCNVTLASTDTKFYISSSEWGLPQSKDADNKCAGVRSLISMENTNDRCLQAYLSHIANYTTGPQTLWVNPSSPTCYPTMAICPHMARVICVGKTKVGQNECNEPTIVNGRAVTPSGRFWPSSVIYTCNSGYVLNGTDNTQGCTENGVWYGSAPTCKAINCTVPSIDNGQFSGRAPKWNTVCDVGYKLNGNINVICLSHNQTSSPPKCQPFNCTAPSIEYGNFNGMAPTWNAVCDVGYKLNGNNNVICLAHNQTSSPPKCQPYNCSGAAISHGAATESPLGTVNRHTYKCNAGYRMTDLETVCVSDIDAVPIVECKRTVCNSAATIPNGFATGETGRLPEENVSLKCHQGFQLFGDGQAVCQTNGSWSHSTYCEAIYCGSQLRIDNGIVVIGKERPTVDIRATFICNDGFHLQGNRTAVCQTTGQWSFAARSCERKLEGTDSSESMDTIYIAIIAVLAILLVITISALIIVYRRRNYTVRTELETDSSTAIQNSPHQAVRAAVDPQPQKPAKYATVGEACTAEVTNQGDESGDLATDEKNTYSFIHPTDAPNKRMASTAQQPPPISQPLEDHYNTVQDVRPAMTTSSKAADTVCDAYAVLDHGQNTPLEAAWEASDTACLYADVHSADVSTHRQASQPTVSGFAASPTDAQLHTAINMNTTYPEPTAPTASNSYAMVDLKKKKDRN